MTVVIIGLLPINFLIRIHQITRLKNLISNQINLIPVSSSFLGRPVLNR